MAFDVTSEQRAQYEADGYFSARKLLAADEVQFLRRQIADVIAHGQNGLNFDNTRMDGQTIKGSGMYRKLALLGRRNPDVYGCLQVAPGSH